MRLALPAILCALIPLASCGGSDSPPEPITYLAQSCPFDTRSEIPIAFIASFPGAYNYGIYYWCERPAEF